MLGKYSTFNVGSSGSSLVVIPVLGIISRVPSFIVCDNSETGARYKTTKLETMVPRRKDGGRRETKRKAKKEKAASAASRKALSLWT